MSGQPTLGRRLAQAAITAIAAVCFVGGPLLPASASGLDGLLPGGNAYWYERANAIAARYNLGSVFVRQMNQESGFADEVIYGRQVSWAGAEGIAQIMRSYHPGVDPLDPEAALDYAARHMLDLLTYFNGDITKALAAYDAGAGAVLDSQAQGGENWLALLPPETQQYVAAIMLPGEPHILTNWAALKQWWERTSEPVHFKRFDERMAASGSLRHRRPRSSSPRLDASRESLQVGRGPRRRLYRPPVAPRHRHQPRP